MMMKIDLTRTIDSVGESFEFEFSEKLPDFEYNGTDYQVAEPITVKGLYHLGDSEVTVSAFVDASVIAPCDRCLVDTKIAISVQMNETFTLVDSEDTYQYSANTLVLDQAVIDNVVLNMPMHILCREDCKGLCHYCGKDLNKDNCECDIESKKANSPFAALDGLFSDKEL